MVLKVPRENVVLRVKAAIQVPLVIRVSLVRKDLPENLVQLANLEYQDYQVCQENPVFLVIVVKKAKLVHQDRLAKMDLQAGRACQDSPESEE